MNYAAIPGIEQYRERLRYLEQHLGQLRPWVPDDLWKYPVSRSELSQELVSFYRLLDRDTAHPDNQDLYLLKGIVCNFLYNLQVEEYYDLAVGSFMHIDSLPTKDYRYLWQLANLLSDSDQPYPAIERFTEVEELVPGNRLHPLFWADYAAACMLCAMPSKARKYFERCAALTGENLTDNNVYQSLLKGLTYPKVDDIIPGKELFITLKRRDGLGILSRPLGIWVPVDGEWQIRFGDFAKRQAAVALMPQRIRHPTAGEIGYTIVFFFDLTGADPIKKWGTFLPNARQVEGLPLNKAFTVYEYGDPNTYKNIGGSHGYAVLYRSECPEDPGAAIEAPTKLESSGQGGGPAYFRMTQGYLRFEEPITYFIMLDTCNFIFEPSVKVFTNLLNAMIIE